MGLPTPQAGSQAINDMVLSLDDYKDCSISIETVESQLNENKGLFILVTGCLNQRKFCQTFMLAPKDSGVYIVLYDMFRFVDVLESSFIGYQEKGDAVGEEPLYDVSASIGPTLPKPVSKVACSAEKESIEPCLPEPVLTEPVSEVACSAEKESIEPSLPESVSEVPDLSNASIVKATAVTLAMPVNRPTAKASPDPSVLTRPGSVPDRPLASVTNAAPTTQLLGKGYPLKHISLTLPPCSLPPPP